MLNTWREALSSVKLAPTRLLPVIVEPTMLVLADVSGNVPVPWSTMSRPFRMLSEIVVLLMNIPFA